MLNKHFKSISIACFVLSIIAVVQMWSRLSKLGLSSISLGECALIMLFVCLICIFLIYQLFHNKSLFAEIVSIACMFIMCFSLVTYFFIAFTHFLK